MLTSIEIENFRCFCHVKVPLRPLTVLVGPNDSGKTSFLRAIELLRLPERETLEIDDLWMRDKNAVAWIQAIGTNEKGQHYEVHRRLVCNHRELGKFGMPAPRRIEMPQIEVVSNVEVQSFLMPSGGVQMRCRGISEETEQLDIGQHGSNVAAIIDVFLRNDRERLRAVVSMLVELVPGLRDIGVATPKADERRIDLEYDNGLKMPAENASVGVKLLIFFVVLAHLPTPPKIILLEEPENGIHPRRLSEIVRILRTMVWSDAMPGVQLIVTTHSPYLLDCIDLDIDEVLVFQRGEDGSRNVEPVDKGRLEPFLGEFMLGELWYNKQEEGIVGAG